MQTYIIESMAQVGCGVSDTKEIAQIVESLTDIEHDTLDAMHNFGQHTTLTPVGSMTRANLISRYSDYAKQKYISTWTLDFSKAKSKN